ncbi:MAG: 30S ribosomal protein S16 [Alphaproteobacteria bacterium]|nr:30S ribosomal protein S16 [Alphaproteobacteria bacterium]
MALAIRLSRQGRKKRPHYAVVVADSRKARDGRFIEKLGTYNPLLNKDDEGRVKLNGERVTYWLEQGAKPSDRVAIFLGKAGLAEMPEQRNNPEKAKPKAAAQQRLKDKEEKAKAAEEAAKQAEEETKTEEAPAEEATQEEAPAEETKAEEAPAEEEKKDA